MDLLTGYLVRFHTLDYFLWGCVKSNGYTKKPETFEHLEAYIRRFIAKIQPDILR